MTLGTNWVIVNGKRYNATHGYDGLTEVWYINGIQDTQIQLDGSGVARYLNFRGVPKGQRIKADFIAYCK